MKRIISILVLMLFCSKISHAKLVVKNNTGCDLSFTVFAGGFGQCEGYKSELYLLGAGSTVTIGNTQELGPCYTYPSYTTVSTPAVSQDWSYVKFYSSTLCGYYGTVGSCVASTTWQSTCYWCTPGNILTANWSVSGISTIVNINN